MGSGCVENGTVGEELYKDKTHVVLSLSDMKVWAVTHHSAKDEGKPNTVQRDEWYESMNLIPNNVVFYFSKLGLPKECLNCHYMATIICKGTKKRRKIQRLHKLSHNRISNVKISDQRQFNISQSKSCTDSMLGLEASHFICCSIIYCAVTNRFSGGAQNAWKFKEKWMTVFEIPLKANNMPI